MQKSENSTCKRPPNPGPPIIEPDVGLLTADDADDRRADDQHDGDAARQHVHGADDDDHRVVGTWRGLAPIGIQLR